MTTRKGGGCCCNGGGGPSIPITDCDDYPATDTPGTATGTVGDSVAIPLTLNRIVWSYGEDGCYSFDAPSATIPGGFRDTTVECGPGKLIPRRLPIEADAANQVDGDADPGDGVASAGLLVDADIVDCSDDSIVTKQALLRSADPFAFPVSLALTANAYGGTGNRTFTVVATQSGGWSSGDADGTAVLANCELSPDPVAAADGERAAILTVTVTRPWFRTADFFDPTGDADSVSPYSWCDPGSPCANQSARTFKGGTTTITLRYYLPLFEDTPVANDGFPLGTFQFYEAEYDVTDAVGLGTCPTPTVPEFSSGYWRSFSIFDGGPSAPGLSYPSTVTLAV